MTRLEFATHCFAVLDIIAFKPEGGNELNSLAVSRLEGRLDVMLADRLDCDVEDVVVNLTADTKTDVLHVNMVYNVDAEADYKFNLELDLSSIGFDLV